MTSVSYFERMVTYATAVTDSLLKDPNFTDLEKIKITACVNLIVVNESTIIQGVSPNLKLAICVCEENILRLLVGHSEKLQERLIDIVKHFPAKETTN